MQRETTHTTEKLKRQRKEAVIRRRGVIARLKRANPYKMHGRGIEKDFIPYTQNIVYEYFDDPNELCKRLKLLTASKEAGNSNHDQEINSIIEELRELKIVQ